MTLNNCFHLDKGFIINGMLKVNWVPFLFEIIEDSHVNNINILYKALETLKLILVFSAKSNENLFYILTNKIKRSILPTIFEKLSFSNNNDISIMAIFIKDYINTKN